MGLNLSKQTMANWIQYAYRDYLKPLIGLMEKQLLRENILHADETPVQVLKEKGRKNKSKSYMWLYATGQYAAVYCIIKVPKVAEKNGEKCSSIWEKTAEPVIGSGKVDDSKHILYQGL